jgi:hypothetical protein
MHNALVDAMLASNCHIIATMRSKTEYVLEQNERGKTVPRKVGVAPVQRDGLEYEFDVVGDMNLDNELVISKTRCPKLTGVVISKPGNEIAETLKVWLTDGAPVILQDSTNPTPNASAETGTQALGNDQKQGVGATQTPKVDANVSNPANGQKTASDTLRPLNPSSLKNSLNKSALRRSSEKAQPEQMQHVAAVLDEILQGTDKRHELIAYLTDGQKSLKDLGPGMILALYGWLKPSYDRNAQKFNWDEMAAREATAAHVEALRANGAQTELFGEPDADLLHEVTNE